MTKPLRRIVYAAVGCILLFFGTCFFFIYRCSHSVEFLTYRQISWILSESAKAKVDTSFCVSQIREKDICNTLIVDGVDSVKSAFVAVWEFKNLANTDLKTIRFDENVNIDGNPFILSQRMKTGLPCPIKTLQLKKNFSFDNFLDVNLNKQSNIVKKISSASYVGFYGFLNRMSFANELGETQILFDYQNTVQPTLILFYKARNSFYMILVNSDEPFDERIMSMFNLK